MAYGGHYPWQQIVAGSFHKWRSNSGPRAADVAILLLSFNPRANRKSGWRWRRSSRWRDPRLRSSKVRDFDERRKTFQQRARARSLCEHGLDRGAGSFRKAAEDFATVGRDQGFRNRIRPQANDANAAGAELTRENARKGFDGTARHSIAKESLTRHA